VRRGDLTVENRAWVRHGLLAGPAWAGTVGQIGGPGTALVVGRARPGHYGVRARPFLGRAF
jgi:hypothetical protein